MFEALREWRLGKARADAVPPYVIAHDSTLLEIETRRPRTEAELRRVPGMGPKKVETYGAEDPGRGGGDARPRLTRAGRHRAAVIAARGPVVGPIHATEGPFGTL